MNFKLIILIINSLLIIWFIFFQNKDYRSTLKWLIFFIILPIFSFFIYFLIGMGIKLDKNRYRIIESRVNQVVNQFQVNHLMKCKDESLNRFLILGNNLRANKVTYYNDITYFYEGNEYYSTLLYDINKAKKSIHIEVYILRNDEFGNTLLDLLLKKAIQGVKVKLVFDPNGNLFYNRKYLKKYQHYNLMIVKQFKGFERLRNFNFRNHRKLVIIDGKIGYVGGFNFGQEYLSFDPKTDPFRDTQIKIRGEAVLELQRQFLIDFYYAYSSKLKEFEINLNKEDFIVEKIEKKLPIQFVSTSYFIRENIKRIKIQFLMMAKKEILIQTPYLILDSLMMETLKLLILSDIKISIMIPMKYDKKIPFCVTLSCARELYNLGARIFLYEGFIHAKTLIVDDKYLVIGSSNFDARSFSINLETDAFIYSYNETQRYKNIFKTDMINSIEYSPYIEQKLYSSFKIGKRIYRLLSSLM